MIKISVISKPFEVTDPLSEEHDSDGKKKQITIVRCSDELYRELTDEILKGEMSSGHQIYCLPCRKFHIVEEKDGKFLTPLFGDSSLLFDPRKCGHETKGC